MQIVRGLAFRTDQLGQFRFAGWKECQTYVNSLEN